jgi:hypothetical protein
MTSKPSGFGCLFVMFTVNLVILGFLALGFAHGPYSSREQEIWYRYGSIGFLLAGAVLPAAALSLGARRSQGAIIALTAWMLVTLFAAFCYAMLSGGGV